MKKKASIIAAALCVLLLAGCGDQLQAASSKLQGDGGYDELQVENDNEQLTTPTPEPVYNILGQEVTASQIKEGYSFELYGKQLNTATTTRLEYQLVEIGDEGLEDFRQILPYMNSLEYLSFDRCGTTDEACAALREEFRDSVKIVWRVFFGSGFTQMSDAETIWASCDIVTNEDAEPLKYFEDLVNLDVGHCAFSDLSFLYGTPKLEVLIVACNVNIKDITPIGSLKNLKYLEICECDISDLSPLANCTELEDLNFGCNIHITDLTPLEGLTKLKRLCAFNLYNSALDMEAETKKFEALLPDAYVDFTWYTLGGALNAGKWKWTKGLEGYGGTKVPRYAEIYELFGYDDSVNDRRFYEYMLDEPIYESMQYPNGRTPEA